jgi:hypothetical protein
LDSGFRELIGESLVLFVLVCELVILLDDGFFLSLDGSLRPSQLLSMAIPYWVGDVVYIEFS